MTPSRNDRGMTVMELVIVMGILTLASSAIFSLVFATFKSYWQGIAAPQVQQSVRIGISRMNRDYRQAGHLINNVTETVGSTTVTFNTNCNQISFDLPYVATVTLTSGTNNTYISATAPNGSGTIPFSGWYATYYLASTAGSTTSNTTGPYLVRAQYSLVGTAAISLQTIASNVTSFSLSVPGGACPTTTARQFTMSLTAFLSQTGQGVQSTATVKSDVTLRNNF